MRLFDRAAYWSLLARYFAGESTRREVDEIQARIAADKEAERVFDEATRAWESSGKPRTARDSEAAWQRFLGRVDARTSSRPSTPSIHYLYPSAAALERRPVRKPSASAYFFRVAAVVVAVIGAAVLAAQLWQSRTPAAAGLPAVARVYHTEPGRRASIQLTDGTQVRLNVDSRLTVSPAYNGSRREVTLEGEAFFDVSRDTTRPFIISTGKATVQVLGTSFNVRANRQEEAAAIAVVEGSVRVRNGNTDDPDSTVLRAGDLGIASPGKHLKVQKGADLDRLLAWREGKLVFIRAPFNEVQQELERWYDLQIDMAVPAERLKPLNATFSDEPLSEILNLIAVAYDLEYTRENRKITFYRPQ